MRTRTLVTQMFKVASGDPWPSSLPIIDEDGTIDYQTCLFMCSFIVIVCWVCVCMRVCALVCALFISKCVGPGCMWQQVCSFQALCEKVLFQISEPLFVVYVPMLCSYVA
jgi:hypothetical protein